MKFNIILIILGLFFIILISLIKRLKDYLTSVEYALENLTGQKFKEKE